MKAATAGTTCKGKVDTQILSEAHLPELIVAYRCGAFYKKEEASIPIRHSEQSGQIIP